MTADRLAALIREIVHNEVRPASVEFYDWLAARLAAAGVTVAPVDSGARQRLLDVIHGMDPQGIPPGGIEPLVDAAISAGVTVGPCERPHRRIAHLPPGIPTCPVCLYRNPGAEPGDTRPIGEHDCKWEDEE